MSNQPLPPSPRCIFERQGGDTLHVAGAAARLESGPVNRRLQHWAAVVRWPPCAEPRPVVLLWPSATLLKIYSFWQINSP